MKCDELKPLKNLEVAYNTTSNQDQVIAEDSEGNCYGFDSWEEVYLKDEVNAAIAELKEKLDLYKRGWAENDKIIAYLNAELRRQKYKRCLAMAKWCESEAYIHEHGSDYDEDLVAWFGKWHKRWLKLADQFKEAK